MTVDFALRLASAAARVLAPDGGRVLIGKDTRLSGYLFESALEAGFVASGVDVMLMGPLPTPGIAYMTQRLGCHFGVVISASHNLYEDNGIKFFDGTGSKLSDEIESRIERSIDDPVMTRESQHLGRAVRIDRSRTQYQEFCASTIPAGSWPIWGPKSCPSAVRRTAATSTTAVGRPLPNCCSSRSPECVRRSASPWMVMGIAWSWSTNSAGASTGTSCFTYWPAPGTALARKPAPSSAPR
jgi:hypothetical protein